MRSLVDATASALAANFGPAPEFQRLQRERFELRQEQREIADQVLGLEDFSFVGDAYGAELNEQRARLSSIGLVPNSADQNAACAMCGQHLGPTSATAHEHVLAALNDTSRRMDLAQRDRPRIERARAALIARRNAIVQQLEQNDLALTALSAVDDLALRSQESLHLTSYVRGRISSFLDEGSPVEDNEVGLVMSQLEAARQRVAVLEDRFDPAEMRSRVTSILASVSRDMTRMASELGLEHAQTGARIDIDRLTVVADTPTGPAYMDRGEIGSGMNWVGYHLSTYLALQRYFITNRRPVPRFIVLDQPSQAFFPRDRETGGDMDELSDTDRESTRQLYSLINDVVDSLDGTLQVIALDHADFGDDWFADSVIHRWRGGTALIPADWLS